MYLLAQAHLGCLGQSPESCKMVVCARVIWAFRLYYLTLFNNLLTALPMTVAAL